MSWATPTPTGVRLQVQVQPRAARTELVGLLGDALKVRLAAPPVEGAANEALVRWLAGVLKVPRASVVIASGVSSRRKVVLVEGASVARVQQLFAPGA